MSYSTYTLPGTDWQINISSIKFNTNGRNMNPYMRDVEINI
jgi:hypothetical protein